MFSKFSWLLVGFFFLFNSNALAVQNTVNLTLIKTPSQETSEKLQTSVAIYQEPYATKLLSRQKQSWINIAPWTNVVHQKYQNKTHSSRSFWDGEVYFPQNMAVPTMATFDITQQVGTEWEVKPVGRFSMGMTNETFVFTPSLEVGLKVPVMDGKTLWVAPITEKNKIDSQLIKECEVQDGYCVFKTEIFNQILVFEKEYKVCPISSLSHGRITKAPECKIVCDFGYKENNKTCVLNSLKKYRASYQPTSVPTILKNQNDIRRKNGNRRFRGSYRVPRYY